MNLTPLHFLAQNRGCTFQNFLQKKKFPPFSSSLNEFAFMQIKQPQTVLQQHCSSTQFPSKRQTDLVKSHKSLQVVTCVKGPALVASSQLAKMLKKCNKILLKLFGQLNCHHSETKVLTLHPNSRAQLTAM